MSDNFNLPIFPLNGTILFPETNLPLNIFEQRYLDLVSDTYKKDKLGLSLNEYVKKYI